jgi:ABC-type Fe2+-enterobactin transport system substrate-binding protein
VEPALIGAWEWWTPLPWQAGARDVPVLVRTDLQPNIETVLAEGIDLMITSTYPEATLESDKWGAVPDPMLDIPLIVLDMGDFEGQVRIVGAALGLEEVAAVKAAEVSALFTGFTLERAPRTVKAFGTYGDRNFYMFKASSPLGRLLERFGLPPLSWPTEVGDQTSDPEAVQAISAEVIPEHLECDLLIGCGYDGSPLDSITDSPLFQRLAVVEEDRFVGLGNDDSFALAYATVLSLPRAREVLTGALATWSASSLPAA